MLLRKYDLEEAKEEESGSAASSLEEENRKTELGRLARRGGQEK